MGRTKLDYLSNLYSIAELESAVKEATPLMHLFLSRSTGQLMKAVKIIQEWTLKNKLVPGSATVGIVPVLFTSTDAPKRKTTKDGKSQPMAFSREHKI